MYYSWIENSIRKIIADKVFVQYQGDEIVGMITVKLNRDLGQIGLVGVDPMIQGKGVGKKLINKVKQFLFENKIKEIEVATQLNNIKACEFYKRCGLSEKKITNIYHFWI